MFQRGELIDAIVVHGVSLGSELAGFIPVPKCERGNSQDLSRFLDGEIDIFHGSTRRVINITNLAYVLIYTSIMKRKILSVFIVSFVAAVLIRAFVIEGFFVVGDSMEPVIHSGDYVFINKLAFTKREPRREEIVIASSRGGERLIKRIIGLPGERVSIEDGKIVIKSGRLDEGDVLEEIYLNNGQTSSTTGISLIKLDPGEYFALGDNRNVSIDSRELGPIDIWDIKGSVIGSFNLTHLKYKGF